MATTANINAVITATDMASKVLKGVGSTAEDVASSAQGSFKKVANVTAVALGAMGGALTAFSKSATDFTADYVKESKNLARQLGTTTEESSRLMFVTRRLGISTEEASQTFGIFSKNIKESTTNSEQNRIATDKVRAQMEKTKFEIKETTEEMKKQGDKSGELGIKLRGLNVDLAGLEAKLKQTADPFQRLGVATKDATGNQRQFEQILFDVADKFKAMPAGIDKTALSMELFGRSGRDMIKFLDLGSVGIQNLQKEADKLGLTLTPGTIDKVSAFVESQKKLKEQSDSVKMSIGLLTTPILTDLNTKLSEMIQKFIESDGPMKTLTTNVIAFGGPVGIAASALMAFGANLATITTAIGGMAAAMTATGLIVVAEIGIMIKASLDLRNALFQTGGAIDSMKQSNRSAIDDIKKSMAEGKISIQDGRYAIHQLEEDMNRAKKNSFWDVYKQMWNPQNTINGIKSFLGMRAEGGPVSANSPYIVGEKGPEMFVPGSSGNIVPNHAMGGVNVNVSFSGVFTGSEMEMRKLAQKVFQAYSDSASMRGGSSPQMMRV